MQIKSARVVSYRSIRVDETIECKKAHERFKKLTLYEKLRDSGCTEYVALEAIETTRSTLFLWKKRYREDGLRGLVVKSRRPHNTRGPTWDKALRHKVYTLRKQYPFFGKEKIHRLLVRDHGYKQLSVSMVGRILSKLVSLNRILPVSMVTGKNKPKKKRVFNKHAKRWKYGMKSKKPGDLVQVDHMSVTSNSKTIKHFKACCPNSKIMISQVYGNATSKTARSFLEKMIAEMPFEISSIQVDGGSEFMKDFEQACEELKIPLFVLPPRSPKYNGVVERTNGVTRDEFYSQYRNVFDLSEIRVHLQKYQEQYNNFRPHQSLDYLTPAEYIKSYIQKEAV